MEQFNFSLYKPWQILSKAMAHPFDFLRWLFSQNWFVFAIIGLIATATYFALGMIFVTLLHLPLLLGNALSYLLSFIVSYLGQSKFAFRAKGKHFTRLWRFASTQGIGLLLNSAIVDICVRSSIVYPVAMLIATVLVPIPVFLLCKFWVFKKMEEDVHQ